MLRRRLCAKQGQGIVGEVGWSERREDLRVCWGEPVVPFPEDGACNGLTWEPGPGENHVPESAEQASWAGTQVRLQVTGEGSVVEKWG